MSPAIDVGPFESGTRNVAVFGLKPRQTGVEVLDEVEKQVPSWHSTSYNHWSYPESARFYAADALRLIETYPVSYLRGLRTQSLPIFLRPVDQNGFLSPNREAIAKAVETFDAVDGSPAFDIAIVVGLGLAFLVSLSALSPRGERLVISAGLLTIVWVIAVGLVGELGENNRFRFKILWLSWAIAAAGYAAAARAASSFAVNVMLRRRERHAAPSPTAMSVTSGE